MGEWVGNLLQGSRTGAQYSARDVVSSRATPGGLELTVGTDDPTGRTLRVTLGAAGTGALRVHVVPSDPTGVSEVGDAFASGSDEAFRGFGGRHDGLDQRGQVITDFIEEENLDGAAAGVQAPGGLSLFPNGPTAAYYPQALFYSSRPYGFLAPQPDLVRFKLDVDRPDAWDVEASAASLDYVVAPGPATTAIRTLTALSGRQPLAPQWALGPELDRLVRNVGESADAYTAALRDDLAKIDSYGLPLTSYRIEGWGFDGVSDNHGLSLHTYVSPADQAQMITALHARGIHALAYLRPWLVPGDRDELGIRNAAGQPYYQDVDIGSNVLMLDFTNPAARAFWQEQVAAVLDRGFDGFMQDYGEQVLADAHLADGSTGIATHDAYLTAYAKATREELTRYAAAHPGREPWFFTRAGGSGLSGSTAYEGGNFPGDETTDYGHDSGLASLTSDMLNRAVGGAYGYGADIGGYLDYTTPATDKQLFLRWAEWAAFSPVFRLHGTALAGTHTPWSYDTETEQTYDALSRLHLRAAPLIERLWADAETTGVPPTRPLWLQFPGEAEAARQDQEWMLGPDVLVAPVVEQDAVARPVYFPAGCWQREGTGATYAGPASVSVTAPLTSLPWFTRCGTDPFAAPAVVGAAPTAAAASAPRSPRATVSARAVAPPVRTALRAAGTLPADRPVVPTRTLAFTGRDGAGPAVGLLLVAVGVAVRRRRRSRAAR